MAPAAVDRQPPHEEGLIMRRFILIGAAAALVLVAAPLAAQPVVQLPEGEGRDVVATACSQCHALTAITQLRQGEQAWRYQVYDMVLRGAQIAPSEIDGTVKYLAASFGPGVPFPGPPAAPVTLPDGAGKELVEGGCALCHGLDRVVAAKRSKGEWNGIVKRMVFFGAPLAPDQATTIAAYLDSKFGAD
jgi:mono/diheme cytochrome c family protein